MGGGLKERIKESLKRFLCILVLICGLPYIITVLFRGPAEIESQSQGVSSILTADQGEGPVTQNLDIDLESYLVGVLAREISPAYEMEALKAQAVVTRTNVLAALESQEQLPESLDQEKLLELWGQEQFQNHYQRLDRAIQDTSGQVLTWQGQYIYAAYHAVSAGRTRTSSQEEGQLPWLISVDSQQDIPSPDYLRVVFYTAQELSEELVQAVPGFVPSLEDPQAGMEVLNRDEEGYLQEVRLGDVTLTGEEFRSALGLNSSCCYWKVVDGSVRMVTKGLGHGLGMSQYGANVMAQQGSTYQEILSHYYNNIKILTVP